MGRRSSFKRRPMDSYQTIDLRAGDTLVPFLHGINTFAEPCCGEGFLIDQLQNHGLKCTYAGDINNDALKQPHFGQVDAIITNPPWSRDLLHPMIEHFQKLAPTWLLLDASWAHTKQASPYLIHCSHIVSVGRLRWIEGTKQTGKDDCAWYRFHAQHFEGPRFYGRF